MDPTQIPAHKAIHKCGICEKTFTDKSNRRRHELASHNGKKYSCKECDKTYTTKSNLDHHYRTGQGKCNEQNIHTPSLNERSLDTINPLDPLPGTSDLMSELCKIKSYIVHEPMDVFRDDAPYPSWGDISSRYILYGLNMKFIQHST